MYRSQNDYLRVSKKTDKNMRKSNFEQQNANSNAMPQPQKSQPQVQVYIIDKRDFKSLVQQLTSPQAGDRVPDQNPPPKRQKIRAEPIKQTSPIPPSHSTMAVQEDPDVSLYMCYLQNLLDESSESNGDQIQQQPIDKYQPHTLAQAPIQPMPQSNGFEPVNMPTIFPTSWFDDSFQQMDGASSFQSEYPQPLNPNFTFSSMPTTQPEVFCPDLDSVVGLDEIFDVPYKLN